MAKVYLSSTVLDLKAERDAVARWLIAAGHQPVSTGDIGAGARVNIQQNQ